LFHGLSKRVTWLITVHSLKSVLPSWLVETWETYSHTVSPFKFQYVAVSREYVVRFTISWWRFYQKWAFVIAIGIDFSSQKIAIDIGALSFHRKSEKNDIRITFFV
jgi:hypothetical protein